MRDGEIFYTLREAQIVIESWRRHYNAVRPHALIGYRAPATEVFVPALATWPAAQPRRSAGHAQAGAKTNPKLTSTRPTNRAPVKMPFGSFTRTFSVYHADLRGRAYTSGP
jgi:hypothetical protein